MSNKITRSSIKNGNSQKLILICFNFLTKKKTTRKCYTIYINKYRIITKYYIQSCYRNDMIFEIKTLKNDCLYIYTDRGFLKIFNQKDEVRMRYLFMELVL